MRYKLDALGYVEIVMWGCATNGCAEYVGAVPEGYESLIEWADNACINAYYLDGNGNLVLDQARQQALENLYAAQTADNRPVVWKDLHESMESLANGYQEVTDTGNVIIADNVKSIVNYMSRMKLSNISLNPAGSIDIFIHGKQMLKNDAITETIGGITFTRRDDGGIAISGTATEDIDYNLSGGNTNLVPIFGIKVGHEYYLNIGDFNCEMKYFNGETVEQVYTGAGGVINPTASKNVTQVLLKIPSGSVVDTTIYPMLEYGNVASEYEEYQCRYIKIDVSDIPDPTLYVSETLYPSDTLILPDLGAAIKYVTLENGEINIDAGGIKNVGIGGVTLFDGYNFVYTTQFSKIELTYKVNVMEGTFMGDVYNNDGLKVSGEEGVLTFLHYVCEGGVVSNFTDPSAERLEDMKYGWLGFKGNRSGNYTQTKLNIRAHIPTDMEIVSARVTIFFNPIRIENSSVLWSQAKNLKLFRQNIETWKRVAYEADSYSYEYLTYESEDAVEIPGAFGDNGWTTDVATNDNHAEQHKVSMDISEYLKAGGQVLYVSSDYTPPTAADTRLNAALLSGAAVVTLDVAGYRKYEED